MLFQTKQPPLGTTINRSSPLSKGLVAAWALNEGGGKTVYDATRMTPTNGTLNNDAIFKKTQIGSGVLFDGTTDYISFGNGVFKRFDGATKVSISVIVRINAFGASLQGIVGRWNGQQSEAPWQLYTNTSTSSINLIIYKEGNYNLGYSYVTSNALSINTNYHIVATWDGSTNTMKMYINGVDQNNSTVSSGSTPTIINADSQTGVRISTFQESAGQNPYSFNGSISNVLLWNRTLSSTEVKQLYNAPYLMYNVESVKYFKNVTTSNVGNFFSYM